MKGKTVLEPSAGKGNIIDYVLNYGAKEVYFCEINKDLSAICERKNATKIKSNFLEVTQEEIIGVNCIVMNPPFSEFRKHIEHAWRIAPDGCEIISLGNYDTIKSLCGNYSEKENLESAFNHLIYKPVSVEKILDTIKTIIGGK